MEYDTDEGAREANYDIEEAAREESFDHKAKLTMIENFQCPGCMSGPKARGCDHFCLREGASDSFYCPNHHPGTILGTVGSIMLGLPKGFNHVGPIQKDRVETLIRLWTNPEGPRRASLWDHLNIPVWAMEQRRHLFVRTYSPRINMCTIEVIRGGKLKSVTPCSTPIHVKTFIDQID